MLNIRDMANESILVVDDQPMTIKLIQSILAGEGYQVRVAANATEALQAIQTSEPNLILMDIHLPGLDGLALTKLLRSNPELRHVKIIAISAYSLTENDERITAAGCDGFIPKPIDTRALAFSIRKYLDGDSTPS
jgi:two-component system, cell cycle response regulator DivK